MPPRYRRRQKLPKRALQLRLTFVFMGISALGLLMQFLLFMMVLAGVAGGLPHDSSILLEETANIVLKVFLVSFCLVMPITFAVGVLATFKFAGPIYRFEKFLHAVIRGERPVDCKLRKGDQLNDFCELLNRATKPLRERQPERRPERQADSESERDSVSDSDWEVAPGAIPSSTESAAGADLGGDR